MLRQRHFNALRRVVADTIAQAIFGKKSAMVMSISSITPAAYAQPPGSRFVGQFYRFPLIVAALAIASLLLPLTQADAAVIDRDSPNASSATIAGLEPAAQQREGRRGGGEMRGNRGGGGGGALRGNRGGGAGREFRAQNRSNIGTAQIDNRQQFRQERRADRQDFEQQRRGDGQGFRQERRFDNRNFNGRRFDNRNFNDRRFDNRNFNDRRFNNRNFNDRRFNNRNFNDRRFNNRNFNDRRFNNRNFGNYGRNWNRGWRNDRRYDWFGFRNQNRNFFRIGRYFPPVRGWNYRRFDIGYTLGAPFYGNSFWINDPWSYRLPPAFGQYRWIRYYGDVLLVDVYTGRVVDVINDFFW